MPPVRRGEDRGRRYRRNSGRYGLLKYWWELRAMGLSYDEIMRRIMAYLNMAEPDQPDRPDRPDRPEPDRPDRPEPDRPDRPKLEVKSVDLQVAANTSAHHTNEYDIAESEDPSLVVRRGQPFTLKIQLSGPFQPKDHDLRLIFEFGPEPTESKRTRASFKVSDAKAEEGKWSARFVRNSGQILEISVLPPPRCIVGKWDYSVQLLQKGQREPVSVYRLPNKPIYILFNPWCKEDLVYLEREDELEEYILDDGGTLFYGSSYSPGQRAWSFGQFSGIVLDCSILLLDESDLKLELRGDPVKVSRKLSALINSSDDDGVLTGNWSGDYRGGVKPTSWTGSEKILQQYYETRAAVKFGQCWVFSGVLTTVCRALGIPCRSITNFDSAHDTDASVTIDEHYTSTGELWKGINSDSVWNFHVWNEAWMRREDLDDGYGGWQVIDATPQESSEDVYQCGPCPVRAIKEGDLRMTYDAPFIFAEVNADKVQWHYDEIDQEFKPKNLNRTSVGKKISTRALKKERDSTANQRNDVTHTYKYPEGTPEERAVVLRAHSMTNSRLHPEGPYDTGPKDLEFSLDWDPESSVGKDFVVKMVCKNTSSETRTIHGHGAINAMYYTGVIAEQVINKNFKDIKLKPKTSYVIEIKTTPGEYHKLLKDGCFLYFTMVGMVNETKQSAILTDKVMLKKPLLNITAPAEGRVGDEFEMTVTFSNPLDSTLTECALEVEGPGITKTKEYPQSDVAAQGTLMAKITLKPRKANRRQVVVVFTSEQLDNITATHEIFVKK